MLTTFLEVFDEVAFGAELPHELLCHHPALLCAHEHLCTNGAHSWNVHHSFRSKLKVFNTAWLDL